MEVRKLIIERFRGIQSCEWNLRSRIVCIVGSGGTTKTTLLDAIGLALSRSYRPQFTDADFWRGDTSSPVRITVAVTQPPRELITEATFGLERSGIGPDGTLHHDPIQDTEPCLLIRLQVDSSLEPIWTVVRPDEEDGRPITAGQRAKLGFFRLGEDVDAHLRWGRSSALSALTESQSDAASVVLDAHRHARNAAFGLGNASLQHAADTVKRTAQALGARAYDTLRAGLDAVGSSSAGLVLHNDTIPLTREGLGTRRLTSLAIQNEAVEGGSIIAIDEVEHGLEPHRLVHLLHRLRVFAEAQEIQVFLTTHSELTATALRAQDLVVARSHGGVTTVSGVDGSLDEVQGTVRSAPAALLARRIIVVEGSTEVGFVRQLCRHWETRDVDGRGQLTAATAGLAVVNGGGGASAAQRTKVFVSLGYPCALLLDNDDRSVDSAVAEAEASGATLIRWTGGRALEDEIVHELDDEGVRRFVEVAAESLGEESVRDRIADRLGVSQRIGLDPKSWRDDDHDDGAIRTAIACAATGRSLNADGTIGRQEAKRGWFKREDGGEELAHLVCAHGAALRETHLARQLVQLRRFVYVNP